MMTKALKGTLAAAAGIAVSLSGVAAAQAQDEGGDVGTLAAGDVSLEEGIRLNGQSQSPEATMISLDLGEGDFRTVYCIQIEVGLLEDNHHEERPWEDIPVEQLPLVLGVLVNGYNGTNAADLIEAAGVSGEDLEGFSADQVAYAGTQAAIWSLTDGWVIEADSTEGGAGVDTAVSTIQQYLIDSSEPVDEPDFEPYFEVDDSEATTEGTTVGPFTVSTNLDALTFGQPEGATIVDENGDEVTSFEDGQSFYVEFAEEQSGTVSLVTDSVTWTTPAGRTFVPVDADGADVEGQRLILAESHTEEYAAEVEFEFVVEEAPSESPKPELPVTGSSLTTVASIGGGVLLAGVVALVLMRRRRAASNWGSEA
ncbi:Cys-Gln thioester bond-forming surface protein [Glycomyces harbinensis]|uniref:LPXTG-motif cell wall anchor domain-containing protein/TQXA domain-containing protein n=1 Tax=Glycomyces harbinensis TaxID=58114 RepID=A0A1G6Z9Q6_9ACTN|nr:Cys-Gln thioester bond-forming surface protein [Glycomyces harbinensis]SDD99484.1 LPXTG-motif cell wall anchor domain-containing protein/TQXA domain-containing protein [Glycomyces harbinensis]